MARKCLEKQFPIGSKVAIIFPLKNKSSKRRKEQGKYKSTKVFGKQEGSAQRKIIKGKNENITEMSTTLKDLKVNRTTNVVREQDGWD